MRLAAILMALAAFCIQLSATSNWGSGAAADGSRYELSPVGLRRALPAVDGSASDACRWWPAGAGNAQLCSVALDGRAAFARLRAAYPLLIVALWTAVVSLFLQVLRVPRALPIRRGSAWLVTVLVVIATACLTTSASHALIVITGRPITYGALGVWMAIAALVFSGASGALQLKRAEAGGR
jgi:hypothetical protein